MLSWQLKNLIETRLWAYLNYSEEFRLLGDNPNEVYAFILLVATYGTSVLLAKWVTKISLLT